MKFDIFELHVFALMYKTACFSPKGMTHLVNLSRFESGRTVVIKTRQPLVQFYGFRHTGQWRFATVGHVGLRIEHLSDTSAETPSLAFPIKRPVLYLIIRAGSNPGCDGICIG